MQGRNLATCLALVVLVWATQAEAYKGDQLAPKAKITIATVLTHSPRSPRQ